MMLLYLIEAGVYSKKAFENILKRLNQRALSKGAKIVKFKANEIQ